MSSLFQRKKPEGKPLDGVFIRTDGVELTEDNEPEVYEVSGPIDAPIEITPLKVVNDEVTSPIGDTENTTNQLNFGEVLGQIASGSGEDTAISGIMELTHSGDSEKPDKDLAMKAETPHVGSLVAGEFMADYNDQLGMPDVATALRNLCSWAMAAGCGHRGKRAGQAFAALNEQQQKEFLLTKEAKGLIQR